MVHSSMDKLLGREFIQWCELTISLHAYIIRFCKQKNVCRMGERVAIAIYNGWRTLPDPFVFSYYSNPQSPQSKILISFSPLLHAMSFYNFNHWYINLAQLWNIITDNPYNLLTIKFIILSCVNWRSPCIDQKWQYKYQIISTVSIHMLILPIHTKMQDFSASHHVITQPDTTSFKIETYKNVLNLTKTQALKSPKILDKWLTYQLQHRTTFCWFGWRGRGVSELLGGKHPCRSSSPSTCWRRCVRPLEPQRTAAHTRQRWGGYTKGSPPHEPSCDPSQRCGSWRLEFKIMFTWKGKP